MLYPKISVVTPSYNQGKFLEATILSVINQGYPNLEYIIIDDGSTDNSVEIIEKYEKYLAYWTTQVNQGQYMAIQKGFERSTGEIMAWLNSDDIYQAGALFTVAQIFSEHPYVHWLQGYPTVIDEFNRIIYHRPLKLSSKYNFYLKDYLAKNHYIQQESTFWRRSLWEKAGNRLDTTFKSGGAGDFELWMRFFRYEKLFTTDAIIASFRLTNLNRSVTGKERYVQETVQIIDAENLSEDDKRRLRSIIFFRRYLLKIPIFNALKKIRGYYNDLFGGFPHLKFDFSQGKFKIINRSI